MKFLFDNKDLEKLYTIGKSKQRLNENIIRKFFLMIQRIKHAGNIFELREPPSNRFEKLQGKKDAFSLRLSKKYRLEFIIEFTDEEKTKGLVKIIRISNHYS